MPAVSSTLLASVKLAKVTDLLIMAVHTYIAEMVNADHILSIFVCV